VIKLNIEDFKNTGEYIYNSSLNTLVKNTKQSDLHIWQFIYLGENTAVQIIIHKKSNNQNSNNHTINMYTSSRADISYFEDEERLFRFVENYTMVCIDFYNKCSVRPRIVVGDIVRHFKATMSEKDYIYVVTAISRDCVRETNEPLITYQEMFGEHKSYVRKYSEFMSFVDFDKYPRAEQIYRFDVIGHDNQGGV